jgi:hypothetical protein
VYNDLFERLQAYARDSRKTKFYKVLWLATLLKQMEMCQADDEKEALIERAQIAAGYTSQEEKGPKTPRKKGSRTKGGPSKKH